MAMVVAFLAGTFSLFVAVRTWRARVYLDLETLLGIIDALIILALGALLARGWHAATRILLLMALFGVAFTFWRGLPPLAIIPPLATAIVYFRAIFAQWELARHEQLPPP